ncbi:hypothetical protein [Hymenobacter guriensis]|uniref:Uncharacterized protein n=1 Tax=Hymenobacter guriensis TaxID=2793065 RepID=A0ABS0L9J6_9BACT|nr:hypothetical protein [Hymenobacter guriensis]MBG8556187.1 hypothetical protein [Hymenobacter guriensis]
MKVVSFSAPLVPRLSCARRTHGKFDILSGFHPTDRLHITSPIEGFDAGTILPVLGFCLCFDAEGNTYAVRAYVSGYGITAAGREAVRFPTAFQQEEIFADLPQFITELDMTECADAVCLERLHEAVIIPMYPSAEHMRKAA